jgi:hypothetical protein
LKREQKRSFVKGSTVIVSSDNVRLVDKVDHDIIHFAFNPTING